jgi:hypothetical protein
MKLGKIVSSFILFTDTRDIFTGIYTFNWIQNNT